MSQFNHSLTPSHRNPLLAILLAILSAFLFSAFHGMMNHKE